MKKLNKKGFVLVETLIVTVFVVALFIVIYQATVPALGELEQQNKYDDIDTVYYSHIYKKLINRYADVNLIDAYLANVNNNYYIDITDCNLKIGDKYVYNNREYCEFVKTNIGVGPEDKILLTNYNIANFRTKVKELDYFDTGILSNFRDYLQTVPGTEYFYENWSSTEIEGKYRLFFIREVTETDGSLTMRFANIGVYSGQYDNYFQGELVTFNPGDGEREFYVLYNSDSTDDTVTLILANNLTLVNNPYFNCTGKFIVPDQEHSPLLPAFRTNIEIDDRCSTVEVPNIIAELESQTDPKEFAHVVDNDNTLLVALREATSEWTNVIPFENYVYNAYSGYTVDLNGYNARVLDGTDISNILKCKNSNTECFDVSKAYAVPFDLNTFGWLSHGLSGDSGYWTMDSIINTNMYAWAIKSGRVEPTVISDHTNIGIRPVIKVNKDSPYLKRSTSSEAQASEPGVVGVAGLYDSKNNLVMDYQSFVDTYGFDVEANSHGTSLSYILKNNSELAPVKKIILPSNITQIGDWSFDGCNMLTEVIIPEGVTRIGNHSFFDTGIKSLSIPNTVTTIGQYAFQDCYSLKNLSIPASVTEIGYYAFNNNTSLLNVTFEDNSNLTTISEGAFKGCTSLTTVLLPNGLQTIGKDAFVSCSNLSRVYIPNTVTTIGNQAFAWIPKLTSIDLPEGLTSIGEFAFDSCGFTSVTIPSTVTSIGISAFRMSKLTSVIFKDPYGWKAGTTDLSPSDLNVPSVAANYISTSAYRSQVWTKN